MGIAKYMATYIEEADKHDAETAIEVLAYNLKCGNSAVDIAIEAIEVCTEDGSDLDIGDGYTMVY